MKLSLSILCEFIEFGFKFGVTNSGRVSWRVADRKAAGSPRLDHVRFLARLVIFGISHSAVNHQKLNSDTTQEASLGTIHFISNGRLGRVFRLQWARRAPSLAR